MHKKLVLKVTFVAVVPRKGRKKTESFKEILAGKQLKWWEDGSTITPLWVKKGGRDNH